MITHWWVIPMVGNSDGDSLLVQDIKQQNICAKSLIPAISSDGGRNIEVVVMKMMLRHKLYNVGSRTKYTMQAADKRQPFHNYKNDEGDDDMRVPSMHKV